MSDSKDKAATPPPAGKTLAKLHGGAPIQAIVPTTMGEAFALAEMVHTTGLAPNSVASPQALTVIFLKGMEVGLPPMAAMECIGIINNKACLFGDGIPSLLWSRGFKIKEWYTGDDKIETTVAHCKITRPEGDEYEFSYSTQDARENGLWSGKVEPASKLPWQRYTKRMTRMRCRIWLARDCAADVLKGIPIHEEQADIELGRGDYREVKPTALAVPDDIPDADEPAAATVSEAEASQEGMIADEAVYLAELKEALKAAPTEEEYAAIWGRYETVVEAGRISREGQVKAQALNEDCAKRFAGA